MRWGYRAMFLVIHNYNMLYSINTLDEIIRRWAQSTSIETDLYIKSVAKRLGCSTRAHINSLDHDTMVTLIGAMSWIENGVKALPSEVEDGWSLFVEERI